MPDIERRTLAEQAYHTLRTAILDGELSAGAELKEPVLARGYGVSRGPVREALRRLSAEGLVTITPRRGARVTSLDRQDFLDAYFVREILEVPAVRLAVPRLTDDHLRELATRLQVMDDAVAQGDTQTLFQANRAFHGLFVEQAGNQFLQGAYRHVADAMGRYQQRSVVLRGDLSLLGGEHRAIYEAAVRGDANAAADLTLRHIHVPVHRVRESARAEALDGPAS